MKLVACERTSIARDGSFLALIKKVASKMQHSSAITSKVEFEVISVVVKPLH